MRAETEKPSFPSKSKTQMEVEPWEALDLDDSDIPSLLRPCRQRRSTTTASASASSVNPLSRTASPKQLSQQLPPSTSHRLHTIPGPAGAVQSAMLRRDIDRRNQNMSDNQDDNREGFYGDIHNNGVISTQDYIQRAVEDSVEFDDDFTRHPWLSALQFLGAENGLIPSTPISSIKTCVNGDKVVQVVAVIKSCTPNGLGGLIVMLKDPTGTVGASIHHKVLSESEFGKNLSVGAVLILREVAIFSPARSTHYINITHRNLVKVFCQNSGSTSKLNSCSYPVQYADPEYHGKAKTVENMSTMQKGTHEHTQKSQCSRRTENSHNHSIIQKQSLFTGSTRFNERGGTNDSAAQRGHINLSQHAPSEIPEDTDDHKEFVNGYEKYAKGGNLERRADTDNMTNSFTKSRGEEIQGSCEVETQRQPVTSKASVPEWTDEQLDELFAGDEDDGSLF